ncbi:spermine synthase-like [Cottoperca gobio]|uniref:Spermine synthase-like n=1 Tax=Cottoperca gobio TaxID=56716 RepID=A0A6J2QEF9_COTGO|nr:spermine synthase-like [Cottoperca gobio]
MTAQALGHDKQTLISDQTLYKKIKITRGLLLVFHCSTISLFPVDSASTVPHLLPIFHEQEMTETVHESNGNGYLATFVGKNGWFATLCVHSHGLVTIDLQCFEHDDIGQLDKFLNALETKLKVLLNGIITRIKRLPALVRGAEVDRYGPTTDGRLIEYDMDQMVHEEDSAFQNIKIIHSQQYGNILILKDLISMGERDLAYNQAIMGEENYAGKDVLILGGADGGILSEMVKRKPKMVTMLDIDPKVIDLSKKYTRGACGNVLDNLKGDCYQIIVSDCVPVLRKYVQEGKTFDYVFNELTEIPNSREPEEDSAWEFLRHTLDMSVKVLRPSGKYLTQANGEVMTEALRLYEEELEKLSCQVGFSNKVVCVPFFMQQWVFYSVWKK